MPVVSEYPQLPHDYPYYRCISAVLKDQAANLTFISQLSVCFPAPWQNEKQ